MPLEKRTRVEIFLPIRLGTVSYRTVTEWLAEELAYSRGGSTLTTPFAGLYLSTTKNNLTRDQVNIIFCDFDLDSDDPNDREELSAYLGEIRFLLMEMLLEEDVWIIYYPSTRVL